MFRSGHRVGAALLLLVLVIPARLGSAGQESRGVARVFICPMRPDGIGGEGETCPRCGMRLVPSETASSRAPILDFEVTPKAVNPGARAVVRLRVAHPGGAPITR